MISGLEHVKQHRWGVSVTPLSAGIVLGFGAAVVQAYFKVFPPIAYGFCMVCHPKDLLNWVASSLFGLEWEYSLASLQFPVLTVLGVLLGSVAAAWQHNELRAICARRAAFYLACGFIAVNCGLALGSCPIRLVLLAAYGSPVGAIEWLLVAAGALGGSAAIVYLARRSAGEGA